MANRRQPRRKGKTETVLNPPQSEILIPLVGKIIANFGALEFLSFLWIDHLSHDDILVDVAMGMTFGKRLDVILSLIKRERLSRELKQRAKRSWQAARALSEVRNVVVHNPTILGWQGSPEGDQPDNVGIPVLRKLRSDAEGRVPYIGPGGLAKATDAIVEVAQDLEGQLGEIREALHPELGAL